MSNHAEHGGKFFERIGVKFDDLSRRSDVINADVLDAWFPPSPRVISAVQENLEWLIKTSPPTHSEGLRETISEVRGVPYNQVVVDAGSSALILRLVPLLFSGKRVCLLDPTYGEYEHQLGLCGATVARYNCLAPNFLSPAKELAAFAAGTEGLILVNPNSPTGTALTRHEIEALLALLPDHFPIVIDETYIDFLGAGESAEALVGQYSNLTVVKSMSKFYSLSGLRVGYLVAQPALASKLDTQIPPWSVGLIGQLAGVIALQDSAYYDAKVTETAVLRTYLQSELAMLGFVVCPSKANFVMFESAKIGATELCRRTEDKGLFLRNCNSLSPRFDDHYVRVAVKDRKELDRLLVILNIASTS